MQPDREGCITEPALRERVTRWFEAGALPAGLEVMVRADAQPVGFSVRRDGVVVAERKFETLPVQCEDRIDAVAVAVAVALEHAITAAEEGTEEGTEGEPESPRAPERAAATPTPGRPAPTPQASAEPPIAEHPELGDDYPEPAGDELDAADAASGARVVAGAGGVFGVLHDAALVFALGAELQLERFHLGFAGLITPQVDSALGGGRAETQLFGGRVQGCLDWVAAGFVAEGCAGIAGGLARARGRGYEPDRRASMAWIAPTLRVAARYPERGTVSARLALDGMLNAVRPRLEVVGAERTVGGASLLGAAAALELLIEIP